ncbi:MAG: tRNA pseudouridine(38-40) synthase TruA [Bacteroidales bacterium]|nr:tRNA pseudouridine(38-40) synthase TruA [Bacteroidales bacterium]
MRYKTVLSYNGSGFFGWQNQPDAISVQETLEKALSTLLKRKVTVTGAGRTDTSVNAIGYTAHFDAPETIDAAVLCYKLNAILPRSITIHSLEPASDDFHSRFDATGREYTYFLHRRKDPFVENYSYFCGYPLSFEDMNTAASLLLGTRDFSCFEKTGGGNRTSVCTIKRAEWVEYTPSIHEICGPGTFNGEYWYFKVEADRFLRNMVRAIVGTLLEVGRGRRSVESIPELLKSGDRCDAGESVPGYALFLSRVDYPSSGK